jgi:hypothetical protein
MATKNFFFFFFLASFRPLNWDISVIVLLLYICSKTVPSILAVASSRGGVGRDLIPFLPGAYAQP